MRNLLVLLLILTSALSNGQQKTDAMLFGDVKSVKSNEHIPFATIQVKGSSLGTLTDASGHFKLANLPVGMQTIIVRSVGFKTRELQVTMQKDKAIELFIDLEEDVMNLEQVVVTGTRTEHYIKDVPIRTEVITSEAISNKNASNLFQALEGTPGIRVENQCSYCNFSMVRMQGLGAEHTQVLINGQPMYSGLAGVYGLQQLATVDISRIEVVKGAGSALYGSSAVAGAINIVTKEPSFVPATTIETQIGNFGTNRFDVSSSMRNEKGNIGMTIFAQRYSEGVIDQTGDGNSLVEAGKADGISDRVETNLSNTGFGIFIDNVFFKNDKLTLRGKSVYEQRQGGTLTDDYYKNPFTDGTENISTNRYEADLQYHKRISDNSEINFSFAFVNHNRNATNDSYLSDYLATHGDTAPDVREMRPYLASENSFSSTLTFSKIHKKHSFLIGIQAFIDRLSESGNYVVVDGMSNYYGNSYKSTSSKSANEAGFFVQDEWAISKKLMLVPGIRFDYHNSGEEYGTSIIVSDATFPKTSFTESSVNPRVAIKYEVNDRITIRANTGTGFRAPYGFSEDLHLCSGSPRVWKSSELNPETSISYNLSGDYYGNKFKTSINIFRTDLKNKIGFTDADAEVSALGYDYQWKNIDDAFVQGIEFSLTLSVIKNLQIGLDLTYNQGEYDNVRQEWVGTKYEYLSKKISRFPSTTGDLKLEYDIKGWCFVFASSLQGRMYIDYYNEEVEIAIGDQTKIVETKPFTTYNARISKQVKGFKIFGGMNNIFNYLQPERHLDDAAFLYAPVYGRLFYAGLTIEIKH